MVFASGNRPTIGRKRDRRKTYLLNVVPLYVHTHSAAAPAGTKEDRGTAAAVKVDEERGPGISYIQTDRGPTNTRHSD